jgi:predicted nuclease of predicted toxin-antitoxin system
MNARTPPRRATDPEILAWSLKQEAAVVTLDADFHAILAVSSTSTCRR